MNRKLSCIGAVVLCFLLIICALHFVSTAEAAPGVKEAAAIKPENRIAIAHTEIFGKLQRPQVIFNHGKHEVASRKEGCSICHPEKDGQITFVFPKNLRKTDKTSVMKAYHDECFNCHKKVSAERKESGPVSGNCGGCHKAEEKSIKFKYIAFEFDFYVHDKHVRKLTEETDADLCSRCHHTYDMEKSALVYKKGTEASCNYCHELGTKRGPELAAIMSVAAKKGLDKQSASHQQCLNCHLKYQNKGGEKQAYPTECSQCHDGTYKKVSDFAKVPRPDRNQPKKALILIKGANMPGVAYNHEFHQTMSSTCRSCHHESFKSCKECHGQTGKPEGNGITVEQAFHSPSMCAGCHDINKCTDCHK